MRSLPLPTREAIARLAKAAKKGARMVFVTRGLNALASLSELDEPVLAAAASAPNDFRVLADALADPEILDKLRGSDPLAPARLRGSDARLKLIERAGGILSAPEAAKVLGLTRQAVDKRRRCARLIGLGLGRRGFGYPAFQFSGAAVVLGLEECLARLQDHDPWMKLGFFVNQNSRLKGKTPAAELLAGRLDGVLAAADAYLKQGAA
jgi:hypothetical protein